MSISIVIPAWNEAELIGKTLEHLKNVISDLPVKEIIVVDNNSSDDTAKIAKSHGAKVVFEKHNQIARARNTGAKVAKGKYLFFIDADTWPSAEILRTGYDVLKNGAVGVGTVVSFEGKTSWFWSLFLHAWNFISKKFKLAAGSFLLCENKAFNNVGGFPENIYAAEEVFLSKKLKAEGKKNKQPFVILKDLKITTSSRKIQGVGALTTLLQTVLVLIFPFMVYSRRLCWMWYRGR